MTERFSEWVFRMRGGLWTLLFVIILFMADKASTGQIITALAIIIFGQVWRFWAAGTIGLYRGENVKALSLASTGPYALMRNPLYFGNFLIGLGWSIIAGLHAVIIFILCFLLLYVMIIIPHEEKFLRSKFGLEYSAYCSRVKRFWPMSLSLKDLCGRVDFAVIKKSEIHTLITTIIGTIIIISVSCFMRTA